MGRKRGVVYVTNKELLEEIQIFWDTGERTDKLVKMIYKMATKISNARNFYAYEFKGEMVQEGVIHALYKGIPGFTQGRNNPFSFLSTVIVHKFLEIIKKEKKNIKIKEYLKEKEGERIIENARKRL